jgi:hypothetical protein
MNAFLDMSELKYIDLLKLGVEIRTTVTRNTGNTDFGWDCTKRRL